MKPKIVFILIFFSLFFLIDCGDSGGTSSPAPDPDNNALVLVSSPVSNGASNIVTTRSGFSFDFNKELSEATADIIVNGFVVPDSFFYISDSLQYKYVWIILRSRFKYNDNVEIRTTAKDFAGNSIEVSVAFSMETHPTIVEQQWHINNTGQSAYADTSGTAGEDINVTSVHSSGIKGRDIVVNIIDTGLDLLHPDYHTISEWSYDYKGRDQNPEPKSKHGDHGTSVGGLVAMLDNNSGGIGVAPEAKLIGHNLLALAQPTYESFGSSLGASFGNIADFGAKNAHVFNQSFGFENLNPAKRDTALKLYYKHGVEEGRDKKGFIYIKSAGNGFDGFFNLNEAICRNAKIHTISCQNSNASILNTFPENIVVSATNAEGMLSSYSTTGSSVWISAPGGEYGANKTRLYQISEGKLTGVTDEYPDKRHKAAMLTTDVVGCNSGYSRSGTLPSSQFNYRAFTDSDGFIRHLYIGTDRSTLYYYTNDLLGRHPDNPNCNFTNTFNGTSSSAPVVSGVAALLLSVKKDLTWRDVKHIFATTSHKIDSTYSDITIDVNGTPLTIERSWATNNAGYNYSNKYGFGRVDAAAAVALAQTITSDDLGSYITVSADNTTSTKIPDNSSDGAALTIKLTAPKFIESIELLVSATHAELGEMMIEVESPKTTKSILLTPFSVFTSSSNLNDIYFTSNAFYGEDASGDWKIRFFDVSNDNTTDGQVQSITLFANGHNP